MQAKFENQIPQNIEHAKYNLCIQFSIILPGSQQTAIPGI